MSDDRILRVAEIAKTLSLSKIAVARLLKSGSIPKVQLTQRAVGALQSNVMQYITNQTTGAIAV